VSRLNWKALGVIAAAIGIGLLPPNGVSAQTNSAFGGPSEPNVAAPQPPALAPASQALPSGTIANNDSIFIDGKNFTITSGRAKRDAAMQIQTLGARDLGPGAIVFRSGEKLYIVSTPLVLPNAHDETGQSVYAMGANDAQPNRIKIRYVAPKNPDLQQIYDRLENYQFLQKIQQILSPLRLPEDLHIQTTECGVINAWYKLENSAPTVTVCYELLKTISQSLPKQTTPSGITPMNAAVGQALWLVLHEVGHATFHMFNVPIFGHEEDAADDFADYIMLQFGKDRARQLIGGAAWAWRGYVADYRTNPVIKEQLAGFASNHGQPQERFYNLMCLAYGADPVTFADLTQDGFLPPSRSPNCKYEYKTLADAFHQEISPHIDREMARRVLDTSWLPAPQSMPTAQK
jgi:hypothetical protein